MADKCRHRGTMTLPPYKESGWKYLDWCFYLGKEIKDDCPKDCPHKDKPVY